MTLELLHAPATRHEAFKAVALTEESDRIRLSPAAMRGVVGLAETWKLTAEQVGDLLGGVPQSTWYAWKNNPPVDLGTDRLTRISLLLGIFASLRALFAEDIADSWVHRPNTNQLFGGQHPLDVMSQGGIPALIEVRALLDGRRGGL